MAKFYFVKPTSILLLIQPLVMWRARDWFSRSIPQHILEPPSDRTPDSMLLINADIGKTTKAT
ncbi:hypothetical protein C4F49_16385 [Sphingobacterium sp. KB22]|uniref:Uncharacterized protein n=1 Tax=Sphingobacterium hungaricum TaxID=2082723 RepID=A0A928YSH6_9SPHI|nr:hypothetical protein [Sphingobacterium hungaricum]